MSVVGARMWSIAVCALLICFFTTSPARQIKSDTVNHKVVAKKPFSALLVEYRKDRSSVKTKTRIYFSSKGIRSERLGASNEQPELVVIKNYHRSKTWLLNPVKQFFAELPEGKSKEENVPENDRNQTFGVLANEPCYGMKSEKQSSRHVRDTELSVWRCVDSNNVQHLQHFSTLLGVVIRQESQDGRISELQDITFIDDSKMEIFEPSGEMQQISIEELISGRLLLPEFVE